MYIHSTSKLAIFDGANAVLTSNSITVNTETRGATGFGDVNKLRASLNGNTTLASAAYNGVFSSASSLYSICQMAFCILS
jgi:hypothetical protein